MKLLVVGSRGMLGKAVCRAAGEFQVCPTTSASLDLTNEESIRDAIGREKPTVIVNCAAMTDVDGAEEKVFDAFEVNGFGPARLVEAARRTRSLLVHVSTDYVFDGKSTVPYVETDVTEPISVYGRSKLVGEWAIRSSAHRDYYVVRTSWLYGKGGKNFVETIIKLAMERDELRVVADQFGTPTYAADMAGAMTALIGKSAPFGVYHYSNEGTCSWHEFASAIVEEMSRLGIPIKAKSVIPITSDEYPRKARRPKHSALDKTKFRVNVGQEVPTWREALTRYMNDRGLE